jgi:hypothetical protein
MMNTATDLDPHLKAAISSMYSKIITNTMEISFNVFTAVMIQIEVFCFVIPCSVVEGYKRF